MPLRERLVEDAQPAAVALLRAAAAAGYFNTRARVAFVTRDSDLDFVRDRADFRAIFAGLAKPSK